MVARAKALQQLPLILRHLCRNTGTVLGQPGSGVQARGPSHPLLSLSPRTPPAPHRFSPPTPGRGDEVADHMPK